ncbi:MAG: TlpA family protein disulfide reductase [Chloroflexi bacterium]|nr:TlpA family protein disulfide reductase [Chloroflexota bacterium]
MAHSEIAPPEEAIAPVAAPAPARDSRAWWFLVVVLALGVIASALLLAWPTRPEAGTGPETASTADVAPRTGALAPDFQLPTLDGASASLQEYRGRVVLINFWATWCAPCRAELPDLSRAYQEWQDQGFVVLAVDVSEPESAVRQFTLEIPLPFPVLLDTDGSVTERYRVTGLPTSFFLDEDGVIRGVFMGAVNHGTVIKKLEQMAQNRAADQARGN